MQSYFKIGDKVRVKERYECWACEGLVLTIIGIHKNVVFPIRVKGVRIRPHSQSKIEDFTEEALIKVEEEMAKFKAGERVKILCRSAGVPERYIGQIGIIANTETCPPVKFNDGEMWYFGDDDLEKVEFKAGDKVKLVETDMDYATHRKHPYLNKICKIKDPDYSNNGQFTVKLDNGYCVKPKHLVLVKKEDEMSEYEEIKAEISKLTAWNKEADDILMRLGEKVYHKYALYISLEDDGAVRIIERGHLGNTVIDYRFDDQCEKLEAFKNAFYWFLDHSDIKDEEADEIRKLKEEIKAFQGQVGKLQGQIDKLEEKKKRRK